jgi:hypothetical protein
LAVFPVADDCRRPLIKGGCHSASRDPETVSAWAQAHPGCNWAVALGGLAWVLDIDSKGERDGFADLADLQRRHGPLPTTWTVETPSGGRHLYFRRPGPDYRWRQRPDERRFTNAAPLRIDGVKSGLDVRDLGASAAVPPSRKPTGPYRWLIAPWDAPLADTPPWLLDVVDPVPPPPPPRPARPLRLPETDRVARYVETAVNGECRELASMGRDSGRNQRLFRAAANLGGLIHTGALTESMVEDALERAALECGLVRDDGRRAVAMTIASGLKRGLANPRELG